LTIVDNSDALGFETKKNPFLDRQSFVQEGLQKAINFQVIDDLIVAMAEQIKTRSSFAKDEGLQIE
jgi:hypothetical protein